MDLYSNTLNRAHFGTEKFSSLFKISTIRGYCNFVNGVGLYSNNPFLGIYTRLLIKIRPNNHNYLINSYSMPISQIFDLKKDSIFFGSWSQNRFSDCFMIQHLKEKQFKRQIKLDFSVCFVIQNWEKNCFWCFSFFLNIGLQNAHLNSFLIESFSISLKKIALFQGMTALFKVIFQKKFRTISREHYSR